MSEWDKFLEKQLQDPEVRAEWEALEPEFAIIQAIIDARKAIKQQPPAKKHGNIRDTIGIHA